jgi:diguanylate cyclase (GGDEF)-like protein/PAS domain S-box-containing protein
VGPAHVADNLATPVGKLTTSSAKSSSPIRSLVFGSLLLIAAIAVATGFILSNLRSRVIADSERELQNVALVLAEQADRQFQAIELVQIALIERIQSLGTTSSEDFERQMSGRDVHLMLKDKIVGLQHVGALTLINSEGKVINFSRAWPIPIINAADRDFFKAFQSDKQLTSFMGEPVRNHSSGTWVVQIARKVSSPKGEFLGLVLGVIELQYFEHLFGAVTLGAESSIALFRRDSVLVARYPRLESSIGKSFAQNAIFQNVLSRADQGATRLVSLIDGKERLAAAHSLARAPIVVAVFNTIDAILADWRHAAMFLIGIAALTVFIIAGFVLLFIRQFKTHELLIKANADKAKAEKIAEQKLILDAALNNMSQGLCMFDSSARLVVCNQRYIRMYNLSATMNPGCSLVDMLQDRGAVGTFAQEPQEYAACLQGEMTKGKTISLIIETGDGRVISVVNQPMAGGGWVATHEDITEQRKVVQERDRDREFLKQVVNNVPAAILVKNASDRRYILINQAGEEYFGISRDQIIGKTAQEVWPKATADVIAGHDEKLLHSDGHLFFDEHPVETPGKGSLFVTSKRLVIRDGKGQPQYCLGVIEDVTEWKRAEDQIRNTQAFLDTIIENMPTPIIVKDAREHRYTLINRATEECFGVSRNAMIGKNVHEIFRKEEADSVVAHDKAALLSDQPLTTDTYPLHTPHNGTRLLTAKRLAIRDHSGNSRHVLTVLEDVTERRRAEQRTMHMAHYDTLTDLPNRGTFNETLDATISHAATTGELFAVLSIDLDRFKEANDTYGHLVGDALLQEAARRLQAAAEGAFVARIGGDEFTLIVAEGEQPMAAAALTKRLLAAFVDDFTVEAHQLKLGVSIGVAIYPTAGTDAKTLMTNADAALYRAKVETRGTALFFEPEMGARLRERHAMQEDLRSAIDRGELLLHYQPQMKMSGETIGFEALVRWQCPKRGMVSPGTFIPLAEESSLIIPVGEWVLREACREAASWPQPLTIAVNISPIQFHNGDLPRLVHSILLETGLAPGRLELEVTESVMINDFSRAVSILNRLKSLGVRIAMDDFGTGYSSLSYLQSFRFEKIKIDRIFICDLEHNYHSRAIVHAVIGLGQSLNLPILAEGVETEAQHAYLLQEGCDEVQGYLTGRPLPIADYAKLVGRRAIIQKNYAMAG